jgi:ABC-type transport system involved in multi-copper enzyme maturation permease subunit
MIAMTWRQHRLQLLIAAALLAALVGYLLYGAWQHASYANQLGLTACLNAAHRDCGPLAEAFDNRFGGVPAAFSLLVALPLLAGLFFGAPLLAREAESGTLQLAWTQSVSRRRWMSVKLLMLFAAITAAAAIVSASISAWMSMYNRMSAAGYSSINRMAPPAFDLTGIAPFAAMMFAFAIGVAAGVLIGRTVPAMAVTVGGYLGAVLPLESLRYTAFLTPRTVTGAYGATSPVQPGAYSIQTSYANAAGHNVPFDTLLQACGHSLGGNQIRMKVSCLAAKGFHLSQIFQPATRYWPLQAVCATILLCAAAVLLGIAAWWAGRQAA